MIQIVNDDLQNNDEFYDWQTHKKEPSAKKTDFYL